MNNATTFINGTFNVTCAKKAMREYINNILGHQDLMTVNAHFAYAIIAETVVIYTVRLAAIHSKKVVQSGVNQITLDNFLHSIQCSNEYGSEIKSLVASYNPKAMNYIPTFFDDERVLRRFIETTVLNTKDVTISNDALNFLCYVLSHILCNLTRIACLFSKHADRRSVRPTEYMYACECFFNGTELRELLQRKLNEIERLFTAQKNTCDAENDENVRTN